MATYNTTELANGAPAVYNPTGLTVRPFSIAVTTALAANDVINLIKIPIGARVTDWALHATGSLGSTLTASLGDDDSATSYMAAATFGQGAASKRAAAADAVAGHLPTAVSTAEKTLKLTVATAASGTTNASIKGWVAYTNQF